MAGFIGISNLLPATVEDGGVRLSTGGLVRRAGARRAARRAPRCSSPSGPRSSGSTSSRTAWRRSRASIAERVYLGTTTQLIVELGPGARLVALEQNTSRARADDRWELGDRVRVGWRPEHAQVLR